MKNRTVEQEMEMYNAYNSGTKTVRQIVLESGLSDRTVRRILKKRQATTTSIQILATPQPGTLIQRLEFTPAKTWRWMGNKRQVSLFCDDETYNMTSDNENFSKVIDLLLIQKYEEAAEIMSIKKAFEVFTRGNIKIEQNVLSYGNIAIDTTLTRRIIEAMNKGESFDGLLRFFENLMLNPSRDAVYQLFGFLEHNDIKINDDGTFTAWKRVTDDYKDFYTRTFDNSPGTKVFMPRNQVDEDKNNTCSYGFHVAAASYIPHYHGGQGRIIACRVNPRDVVAIPTDYANAKMRVNEYFVDIDADVTDTFDNTHNKIA